MYLQKRGATSPLNLVVVVTIRKLQLMWRTRADSNDTSGDYKQTKSLRDLAGCISSCSESAKGKIKRDTQ